MKKVFIHILATSLALVSSGFAQANLAGHQLDIPNVPKNFENFDNFQINSWGPVTYSGDGKCDILDLYQSSVTQNLGYSTIVDYHFKQIKYPDKYTCESWGLGLSFKVIPDSNIYSRKYNLSPNSPTAFSAKREDAIKKLFFSDSAFLEVESLKPVSFQDSGKCHTVDFLYNMANEQSGFHGIIDIKSDEAMLDGKLTCTFWGLGVKYKHRDIIEKEIVKKRVVEVIKAPLPKPDTVFVPKLVEEPSKKCCITCCCCDH
ncbi:hypothetical protein [Fibrobacter sp.]|uniref:hypothetical protein n=1 Tax=Fibrobacter sp. TaxID=35828 RepID=UPI002628D568|nr:hypothetical protein [Fibrobacter sp.]MDD7498986.1 hypothetical protein [Fibrobacter sp.]MDY5724216.1 hypothetical protein [Fibrobacter sp.]